jgi:hypothetical protein
VPIFIDENEKLPLSTKSLDDLSKNIPDMAEKYIGEMLPLWKRFNINTRKTDDASKIITREKCVLPAKGPYNDTKGQPGFDRLAVILPETVSAILIYPPVKGDSSIFQAILEDIREKGADRDPETVILFAPPFYSINNMEANKNILANFLKFKLDEETKAIVYVLTQNTDANKMVGCQLYSQADKPNKPLINMLEPTYVIYPFTRTVADKMVGSILISASGANEVNLPASNIRQISSVSSYFSQGGRGFLAYPPDVTAEDHNINKMLPPFIYRFYGPKAVTFDRNVIIMDLKGEDTSNARREYGIDNDVFIATDEDRLTLDGVDYETMRVMDMPYSIRKPSSAVRNDWGKYKFTVDEAELLNNLHIKPTVLNSYAFRGDGNGMLVKFLANMINSKCYTDKDLLTKEECAISEEFIDKVYSYLLEHDPRIDEGIQAKKSEQMREEKERKRDEDADLKRKIAEEEVGMLKEALKKLKERFGLDDSVTDESLLKDPYEDGVLVEEEAVDDPEFNTEFLDTEEGRYNGKYYMFIASISIINDADEEGISDEDFHIARLYVDVKKEEEVSDAIDAEITKLSQEYPGWKFFKEPGDKADERPATAAEA